MDELNPTLSGGQEEVVDLPEENRNGSADDGQEEVVAPQQGEEGAGAGESGNDHDGAGQGGTQTREENAAIRQARLRERAEAERRARAEADEEIAQAGIINPYTGKPFRTLKEWTEYGKQYREAKIAEEAKKTGKTVEELMEEQENKELLAELRKQKKEKAERSEQDRKNLEFAIGDIKNFRSAYPDVDVQKLTENKAFLRFAGSRYGKEPLADLYGDFSELVSDAGRAAVLKSTSKAERGTGGGNGGEGLTKAQAEALREWNAANPDMPMTAKEFLKR